jgi:hypothetical protein
MNTFYAVLKPAEVNGRLAAHDGKLVVHLPNYFILDKDLPVVEDGSTQVFEVDVPDDLLDIVDEGKGPKPRIWSGARGQRSRSQDLVTVAIRSLPSADKTGNQLAQARAAFATLPREVQVAAVVLSNPEVSAALAGKSEGDINIWADATLKQYAASQQA